MLKEIGERQAEIPECYRIKASDLTLVLRGLEEHQAIERHESLPGSVRFYSVRIPKEVAQGQESNQDSEVNLLDSGGGWFLTGVMDGVGGAKGGSEASKAVKKFLGVSFKNFINIEGQDNLARMITLVEESCQKAKEEVQQRYADAATTVSLTVGVREHNSYGEEYIRLCSVNGGDSRGYVKVGDVVRQTTVDHSVPIWKGCTPAEAFVHPRKNEIVFDAFFDPEVNEGFNNSSDYPQFHLSIGETLTFSRKDGDVLEIYHMTDGVTDNLRDDADSVRVPASLDDLPFMEISRRIRAGVSPLDLSLAARYRMEDRLDENRKQITFAINVQTEGSYGPKYAYPKVDDIAVTQMLIKLPEKGSPKKEALLLSDVFLADKHLLGILADWVWGDLAKREDILDTNFESILSLFKEINPNVRVFETQIEDFLKRIKSSKKRNEYRDALLRFINLVYGKGITHETKYYVKESE